MIRRGVRITPYVMIFMPLVTYALDVGLTYEQYEKELASLQEREKGAKEQIASEQAQCENLKSRILETAEKNAATIAAINDILGVTEKDAAAADAEIVSLRRQLDAFINYSPDEIKNRQNDITALQTRFTSLKKAPVSFLRKIRDQLPPLEQAFDQLKSKALAAQAPPAAPAVTQAQPAPKEEPSSTLPKSYTVRSTPGGHESLFQIAAKASVYGDPNKWTLLYRSNKAKIDERYQSYLKRNPEKKYLHPEDLIFPGQILDIPR